MNPKATLETIITSNSPPLNLLEWECLVFYLLPNPQQQDIQSDVSLTPFNST